MIMEEMKAMIHDQDLPMHMWEEVSKNTVYMQNTIPHKVLENKTPEDIFLGDKSKSSI
jgi:hypothetical protein